MTDEDRIEKLQEAAKSCKKRKLAAQSAELERRLDKQDKIRELAPRIDYLLTLMDMYMSLAHNLGKDPVVFATDGFSHELGFFFAYPVYECVLRGIGIKAGGRCGDVDLCVDRSGDCFAASHTDGKDLPLDTLPEYFLDSFLDDFAFFEATFKKYVDQIIKQEVQREAYS